MFQEYFKEVLFDKFVVAWISSQLPEQKEGLFTNTYIFTVEKDSKVRMLYSGAWGGVMLAVGSSLFLSDKKLPQPKPV